MIDRRRNVARRAEFVELWTDLRARLRRVCDYMNEDERARLAAKITRVRLKYQAMWNLV